MKNYDKPIKLTLPKWKWVLTWETLDEYLQTSIEILKKEGDDMSVTEQANYQMKLDYIEDVINDIRKEIE